MSNFVVGISRIRDSVAAVLKISQEAPAPSSPAGALPTFGVAFVGTAWCVVRNRCFVTAQHVFNNGQARNPSDRFVLFFVPANGLMGFHTPVTGFAHEDAANDMAIVEIGAPPAGVANVPAGPLSLKHPTHGTPGATYRVPPTVV